MIPLSIPGFGHFELRHIVSDYNGTLAQDGILIEGVAQALRALCEKIEIHVVTADTFGLAHAQLAGLPVTLTITPAENQAQAKLAYIEKLGASHVVAIGNGRNDQKMLKSAALGIAVIQKEGASAQTIVSADVVSRGILEALDLLDHPDRLKATLRS